MANKFVEITVQLQYSGQILRKFLLCATHPHSWITNNRNMSNCLAIPIIGISKQFIPLVPRTFVFVAGESMASIYFALKYGGRSRNHLQLNTGIAHLLYCILHEVLYPKSNTTGHNNRQTVTLSWNCLCLSVCV